MRYIKLIVVATVLVAHSAVASDGTVKEFVERAKDAERKFRQYPRFLHPWLMVWFLTMRMSGDVQLKSLKSTTCKKAGWRSTTSSI